MSRQVEIEIEYELSDDEQVEKAKEAVRLSKEYEELFEQFKDDRAAWRGRLKNVKAAEHKAQQAFLTGAEIRVLVCTEVYDREKRIMQYINAGKVIRERPATTEEVAIHSTTPLLEGVDASDVADVLRDEKSRKRKKDVVTA
jgi:hypothetical protein